MHSDLCNTRRDITCITGLKILTLKVKNVKLEYWDNFEITKIKGFFLRQL